MRRPLPLAALPLVCALPVATTLVVQPSAVQAQEAEQQIATPAPTPTPEPTPLPATDIPDRAAGIGTLLREAAERTDFDEEIGKISAEFEKEKQNLVKLTAETRRRLEAEGPASIIEEAENAWIRSGGRLDAWLSTLKARSTTVAENKQMLDDERALWQLTASSADEVELPDALRHQIDDTLTAIDEAAAAVRSRREDVLTLQAAVAKEKSSVDEMLAAQREEITLRRRSVVGIDSPPLWKTFTAPGLDGGLREQLGTMWSAGSQAIVEYVAERRDRLLRQSLFFGVLVVVLFFLRRRAALWAQQDRSLRASVEVLERPVSAAFIITMLLGEIFHPRAPAAWIDLMGLAILLALLRILPRMLPHSMRSGAYLLALVFFLQKLTDFAPDGNLINRLSLFAVSATAAGSCYWLATRLQDRELAISAGWRAATILGSRIALALFLVSVVANVIGAVGFSVALMTGTLTTIYAAILIWVAAMLARAIVGVVLLTTTARRLAIVRLYGETVRRNLFAVIRIVAVIGWAVLALRGFGVLESAVAAVEKVVVSKVSVGDFSFSPGDILIFLVIVYLSFKISQLLRFVFEADVMPHFDLPRGVPGAISRLSHYAIVVLGVMIAATAAGMDFSRINLIVGALGVGIGFGLQNVVNNFVSGLILLFERPIRVGDRVQLDQFSGTVKDIGMRASVVRTWDGAEVIVPNANLISSEVINWTLSDERRRVEIPVGVAYGTDPQTVLDLLLSVATGHSEVLTDPEPVALFLGFGESTLNFELRAWVGTDFLRVASELRVAVSEALAASGIHIPFPQRDLHLRSIHPSVSENFSGKRVEETEDGAE